LGAKLAKAKPPSPRRDPPTQEELELLKFDLERSRYRTDLAKWALIALGAVVSFAVIDYGKLQIERFQATAENQRQLLQAYLTATEAAQPDVWKRKLHVIQNFATDDHIKTWADAELRYIESFAAKDSLYKETVKVASQLVDPSTIKDPERASARSRYMQLYYADLVYAGEEDAVKMAMNTFKDQLLKAEANVDDKEAWGALSLRLLELAIIMKDNAPKYQSAPTVPAPK
jgi:hypothetical protein